ncbi:MAG: hypothetical protein H0U10_07630 [Chloroflexia bacterium]|nr:hypothetical protein [Chloroflexia bacterium]
MDVLGPFALISLFYLVLGARVVVQLARSWRATFDRNFTAADRRLVNQAAFFVLVPVSVALHELGHAVAITALGGRVLSWGYYGFAGFVGYDPRPFSDAEQIVIAAAGTLVNLAMAAGALGLVFLRRPPLRAAFNELLLQFVVVSLLNALVVYPLLDVLTGMNGDWTQMYDGGVPALSAAILALHVAILGGLWWAWRNDGIRARVATLTGAPAVRTVHLRRGGHRSGSSVAPDASVEERLLEEAAERVASGWPQPVQAAFQATPGGTMLVLSWQGGGLQRAVLARVIGGQLDLAGVTVDAGARAIRRPIRREGSLPDADRLTLALRLAMETVETWTPTAAGAG